MAKIAVATKDGGTGKTALAYALARDLKFYLTSNDKSFIDRLYNLAEVTASPVLKDETVYDFGGFSSAGVIDIIKACDVVIVPVVNDLTSIEKANETIGEILPYNKEIIVVHTRGKAKDFKRIKEELDYDNLTMLSIRDTSLFKDVQELGYAGVSELLQEDKRLAYSYRFVSREYEALLAEIVGDEDAHVLVGQYIWKKDS